jgi:hypothetical protein
MGSARWRMIRGLVEMKRESEMERERENELGNGSLRTNPFKEVMVSTRIALSMPPHGGSTVTFWRNFKPGDFGHFTDLELALEAHQKPLDAPVRGV